MMDVDFHVSLRRRSVAGHRRPRTQQPAWKMLVVSALGTAVGHNIVTVGTTALMHALK